MAREMKMISESPMKERGKKWFPQLVDKCKDILLFDIFVCIHIHKLILAGTKVQLVEVYTWLLQDAD